MNQGKFEVDILDKNGAVIGTKPRKDIIKGSDIYHAVYCVLVTPRGEIAISKIAAREDMPNLHAGSYGCTAATIKRTGETGSEAMERALRDELSISAQPILVEEEMIEVDNTYRKIGLYEVASEAPNDFNKEDIEDLIVLSKNEFKKLVSEKPETITPLLLRFWNKQYSS